MTLNLTKAKVGDRLLLKNNAIVKIEEIDVLDEEMPIYAHGYWYAFDGKCKGNFEDAGELDVIRLLLPGESPAHPSPSGWIFDGEDSSLTLIGTDIHPTTINCNNKIYTPADSWPEPIADRMPTEEDADDEGGVQFVASKSGWNCGHWSWVKAGQGWQHTHKWKPPAPKPPTLKEAAENVLEYWHGKFYGGQLEVLLDALQSALEFTK